MADPTLLMLAHDIRARTLKLVADVTDEQARFAGHPGLNNSVLWHAGHVLVTVEHLGVAPALGTPVAYPAGWFQTFGQGSTPAAVTAWPTLAEVTALLQDQSVRLTAALNTLRPERLDQVIDAQKNRTLRASIVHGLLDESRHQGEILLLKKLWARR